MDRFITSIKRKYLERLINREKQWPPCKSNKLVRLELVERGKGEGFFANLQRGVENDGSTQHTSLAYGDLFKVNSRQVPVRKVLVEGDAGIGKTTLCTAASEDWAKGKLFQQFELVLLLPLRYKEIALAGSISELLKLLHSSSSIRESVASYLEENEGEAVLIIADGWDELSESERHEESFLFKLFFVQFPFLSVLLTSRPSASAPLHRLSCIDQFIEVRGFANEDIKEYIQSEFISVQKKVDCLLEQLESNPLVESICTIPLNCAIVCHLWRTLEEPIPTTLTDLYTKIILNVILRNIQKIEAFKYISELSSFVALPESLKESWLLLCEFAFHTKTRDQIVFSQQELSECFPQGLSLDEKVLCFGLLQHTETIFETGRKTAFHFLHLTFQEYLAALYLVRQPTDKQLEFFQSLNVFNFSHLSIVLRFCFGVAKSESRNFVDQLITSMHNRTNRTTCRHLCHFAFEAMSEQITDKIIKHLSEIDRCSGMMYNGIMYTFYNIISFENPHTAHDCAVMMYVIASIQEKSKIKIDFSSSGIREKQIKTLTHILTGESGKLQVAYLDLSHNKLTDESVSDLFSRASAAFGNSLRILSLCGNKIGADGCKSIAAVLEKAQSSELTILDLSNNPLGVSGLQALEGICGSLANLMDLNLQNTDMNGAVISVFLESLSAHCHHIRVLNISENNVQGDGVSVMSALSKLASRYEGCSPEHQPNRISGRITEGLRYSLNKLNIGEGLFSVFANNQDSLTSSLCKFDTIRLEGNGIQAGGVSQLARTKNTIIYTLSLDDNPLRIDGAQAIGEMLSSRFGQIKTLRLSRCQLTDLPTTASTNLDEIEVVKDVGRQLCQLPQNATIRELRLDGNSFNGQGVHILAGFIHLCSCLITLRSCGCGITSDDLGQLFNRLSQCKVTPYRLRAWYLRNNEIDDDGVYVLMEHLPSLLPNLWSVYTDGNQINIQVQKKLTERIENKV